MFMLLLAMFQTLLHHHTGQTDLLVGAPIANRNRVELEALIGLLGNGIVLRTNLAGNPTIEELLDRVRETVLDAHAHQNLPFGKLMELYQPTSGPPMPPFQVMFNLLYLGDRYLELPGLSAEVLSPPAGLMCEVDLILWVVEQDGGILPSLIYNAELFNASTIDLMLRQFHCLLETIVATSHQHLSDLLQSLTEDG
jgi:non-ribosomal peptide synthetase component F